MKRQLQTDILKLVEFAEQPKDYIPEPNVTPEWIKHTFYIDIHKMLVTGQYKTILEKYNIKETDELKEIGKRYPKIDFEKENKN